METIDNVIIQNKATSIFIGWKELPFIWSLAVLWRGIYFTVSIKAFKIQFGETRIITFKYNGKEFPCSLTKWKYTGGSNGIYPPQIETESHSLKIKTGLNFFELTDMPKSAVEGENFKAIIHFVLPVIKLRI
jgi:hypothetical protein